MSSVFLDRYLLPSNRYLLLVISQPRNPRCNLCNFAAAGLALALSNGSLMRFTSRWLDGMRTQHVARWLDFLWFLGTGIKFNDLVKSQVDKYETPKSLIRYILVNIFKTTSGNPAKFVQTPRCQSGSAAFNCVDHGTCVESAGGAGSGSLGRWHKNPSGKTSGKMWETFIPHHAGVPNTGVHL